MSAKNETKNIGWRLLKVTYALLLLFGLIVIWIFWIINEPYTYKTYSYKVTCDNGKEFDPTSKPIHRSYNYNGPDSFNVKEIKAECKYGTAWEVDYDLEFTTYSLTHQEYSHTVRTQIDQIKSTVIAGIIYLLLLEVVRRTFLYVFTGRKFI